MGFEPMPYQSEPIRDASQKLIYKTNQWKIDQLHNSIKSRDNGKVKVVHKI